MAVEVVTIQTEQPVETKEQQQALLDRADGKKPETGETLILGKFKSQDDLVKAYAELERQFHASRKPAENPPEGESQKPEGEQKPTELEIKPDAEVQKELEQKGLDFNKYNNSFFKNGDLTAEEYAELEKAGYPKEIVGVYVEGLKARVIEGRNQIFSAAGGEESYKAMITWAKANLSAQEIEAYNNAIVTDARSLAVKGLHSRYMESVGREGNLVTGRAVGGVAGYTSRSEMTAAMSDPRYLKDRDYTREVEQKVALMKL